MERKRDDWGMAAIQEEVLDGFFNKLGNSEGIDKDLIEALRVLFKSGDKLKADDLFAAFVAAKREGTL